MSIYQDSIIGDKKMVKCVECGRKVKAFRSYRHPTKGRQYIVCRDCYDYVNESVNKWKEVVMPYTEYFKKTTSNKSTSYKFVGVYKRVTHGIKMLH